MALINCPECGKDVSTSADACPHCGYPINKQASLNTEEKPAEPFPKPKDASWIEEWKHQAKKTK